MKILAGIYVPDKSKGGVNISGKISPFLELGVGFNPELTGRENIFLGGTILGLTKKQIEEKYDSIVAFSELKEFIDMKLKNYSSGMQVRLAFSLSINVEADILLMDEVLAVGDTNFQAKCLAEFNRYKEMGKTVVLVTHDVAVVRRYCDRAMLLRSGKVVKIGKAEEVGGEYMNQNMSDEEKRMEDELQRDGGKRLAGHNDKSAEITKVEFLGEGGVKKNVFESGEDVSVRVYFKHNKELKKLNFGMTLLNIESTAIIGVSTIIDKIDVKKITDDGYFQVDFPKFPLNANTYYINAAVFGMSHEKVYDYVTRLGMFKIYSKSQNDGLVALDYKWENPTKG